MKGKWIKGRGYVDIPKKVKKDKKQEKTKLNQTEINNLVINSIREDLGLQKKTKSKFVMGFMPNKNKVIHLSRLNCKQRAKARYEKRVMEIMMLAQQKKIDFHEAKLIYKKELIKTENSSLLVV